MGCVTLTKKNIKTLTKRQKMVEKKTAPKTAPKAEPPKTETIKEPTVAELKVFADLIKNGAQVVLYSAANVGIDERNRLTVGWCNGSIVKDANPMNRLWDVTGIVTELPSMTDMPSVGYLIRSKVIDGKTTVQLFQKPGVTSFCSSKHTTTIADKVQWVNDGKPCAYIYGFSYKGARAHRISTGEAKDRLLHRKYMECDVETKEFDGKPQKVLLFSEYSEGDMW